VRRDWLPILILWVSAFAVIAFLLALIIYIAIKGIPILSLKFLFTFPRGIEARGGIFPTIMATFYTTILAGIFVTPVAVGGAVFLTEYAEEGWLIRIIRFGADILASVPSIVFGLFGLALFVYAFGLGYSMLAGGLTLSLMILPIVMRATEEAIMAIPQSYREASYGLGATKWQTIKNVVLPTASPRIVTGIILGIGRAFGETAALIFTAGMAINFPYFPSDPGRTMTCHLYLLATEGISTDIAFGTAFLLLIFILAFNLLARRFGEFSGGRR
jgi:phosphate transport system permease protein